MKPGMSEEKRILRWGRFVVSDISVGIALCGGNALVTFVVISIPGACSNYFAMFTFRTFVNEFLLSNAYNHSKQTLDFMQTTTNKNCKGKETCIYLKGGVWPSSLHKKSKKLCGNNLVKFQLC